MAVSADSSALPLALKPTASMVASTPWPAVAFRMVSAGSPSLSKLMGITAVGLLREPEPVVVVVHHEDLLRAEKASRQGRRQPHRSGSEDGDPGARAPLRVDGSLVITVMSSFPRTHCFLTADCELLIHERKMKKHLHLEGALRVGLAAVHDVLAQIESGQRLEREGFQELVQGTSLSVEDVLDKVYNKDCYLTAKQALEAGLIGVVV